jgi:hypothetical protein
MFGWLKSWSNTTGQEDRDEIGVQGGLWEGQDDMA